MLSCGYLQPHHISAMSGLSLWLSPPPSSKLSGFIREQAAQLAAASPTFASHATLVSDEIVPAGVSVEDLVAQIKTGVARWKAARGAHGALTLPFDDVRQGTLPSLPSLCAR